MAHAACVKHKQDCATHIATLKLKQRVPIWKLEIAPQGDSMRSELVRLYLHLF